MYEKISNNVVPLYKIGKIVEINHFHFPKNYEI